MFGPVVSIVLCSWSPIKSDLALRAAAAEPVELHVDSFGGIGYYFVVDESLGNLIVHFDWRPGLRVA